MTSYNELSNVNNSSTRLLKIKHISGVPARNIIIIPGARTCICMTMSASVIIVR